MATQHEIIVIGGGIAGLTAAIYAKREGKDVLVLEKAMPGGQIVSADKIENYPGSPEISGIDLASSLFAQALKLQVPLQTAEVLALQGEEGAYRVRTAEAEYTAERIIFAAGCEHRLLGLPKEGKLFGKGISVCATCDGALHKGRDVLVYGGGNTALSFALTLSRYAKRVRLLFRGPEMKGEQSQRKAIAERQNIEVWPSTTIVGYRGEEHLEGVEVEREGKPEYLPAEALFMAIGMKPETKLLSGVCELDAYGYVLTDERLATSRPGLYAAGDCRSKEVRQLTTAASDGTIAAIAACAD